MKHNAAAPLANLLERETSATQPGFWARLYIRDEAGYGEERKLSARGVVAERCQLLRFQVPADALGLRLDPAEQPGFIQVQAMRLWRDGHLAWDWRSEIDGWQTFAACPRHQMVLGASSAGLVLLCGDDPWIELPIAAEALAGATDLQLEVELGWPASKTLSQFPETVPMALDALALQTDQGRELTGELAQARGQQAQDRHELRRLNAEKDAMERKLGRLQGLRPPVQPIASTVDVVVPVYLGLDDTRRCVQAVLSCPTRTAWRLVLVNDASPDPELTTWLRELAASEPRLVLLENPANLGYSGSVNRGISASGDRDVVLLNSDAEVANDWLDRLRAAAYSDERVCSVTPFSNNATICSYPDICESNPLPAGWSVAALDHAFALANPGRVLDIPTAVGFCMYVRRDCLREVGLFDMETFGKGYGEENDFCLRAAAAGWRNLHALDVFVRHTGGVSFGDSKARRELDAMVTLRRLYPHYEPEVLEYIRVDPPAAARKRADKARESIRSTGSGRVYSPRAPQPLFKPLFRTEEVLAAVRECLQAGWTGAGYKTAEFERRWCEYTGLRHAHFLNSATAGLHTALALFKENDGWQDGDEVISTPLTFVSTNHAILHCKLKPVFADVDEHLTLDPQAVERCITPRTRAVMFVGLGGNTGRLEAIEALCRARGLRLVLDAAHMSGTRLRGRHVGAGADAAVFSFHAVKNLPTADAGAVCFRDPALDSRARQFSWLGIDRDTFSRTGADGRYRWEYDVPALGFKYHGNSVQAAMALVGLKYLDEDNIRRRELCAGYDAALGAAVERVPMAAHCESSRHLYQVLVDDRARVIDELAANGIQCGVHYRDNSSYPMYSGNSCERARRASERVLSLPLHVQMTRDDVSDISRALTAAVG